MRRLTLSTWGGIRTITAVQHYDINLLSEASTIHFAGAEPECEEDATANAGFVTVTIDNAAAFSSYFYSTTNDNGDTPSATITLDLNGDLAIVIGNATSGGKRYALIDLSNLVAGDNLLVSLDKEMREVQVEARADVNPEDVWSYWFRESGERFTLGNRSTFTAGMSVYGVNEPGRFAIYSQSLINPSRVDEAVFGDATTVTDLTLEGRNSDLQSVLLADRRFYFWSAIDRPGYLLGQLDYGNVIHSYMAAAEQNPLVMPDVPSDLLVVGEVVENEYFQVSTLDPLKYSTLTGAGELRVNGSKAISFGPVDYTADRSVIYNPNTID